MSPKAIRVVALVIAALLLGAFLLYQFGFLAKESPESIAAAPPPNPGGATNAIPVKAQLIRSLELTDFITVSGSTLPAEEVMVSSEVPGKVKEILFREGDVVKKGASLIHLDDDELMAQRNRLEVQARLNEKIAERLKALYEKEGVSLQELEIAEAEYQKALSELTLLDAQLEKRVIRAPFSGRLGLRLISEGSYLAPGTAIVPLVKSDPIKIEFSVPEKYSRMIGKGTNIEFQVDGIPGRQKATVEAADPTIDATTRTFRLKASAQNPGSKIIPGAFANVRVNLKAYDQTILVPTEAVVPELGGKKVFVYRGGQAESVPVTTGIRQEARIQVTEGLEPGDTIITTGVLQIRPGAAVTITELE